MGIQCVVAAANTHRPWYADIEFQILKRAV